MNSSYIAQIVSKLDSTEAFTLGVVCGGVAIYGMLIIVSLIDDALAARQRRRDFAEWATRNGVEIEPPPTFWQQYVAPFTVAARNVVARALVWLVVRNVTHNR